MLCQCLQTQPVKLCRAMKKDHELSGGDTLRKQTLPWQKATGIMIHLFKIVAHIVFLFRLPYSFIFCQETDLDIIPKSIMEGRVYRLDYIETNSSFN